MPDLFTILISIGTGGLAAAVVTGIANWLSKLKPK